MVKVDVVINGGGMVGLVLALALSQADFKVAVIEAGKIHFPEKFSSPTARVCAINLASLCFLKQVGLWQHMDEAARASLQRLVVWDDLGGGEVSFDAAEISKRELGFIVDNREIIKCAWQQLREQKQVELFSEEKLQSIEVLDEYVELELESGEKIQASLCIGADGANSWLRHAMDMQVKVRPYQHQAIIAVVETKKPHENTGWQNFLTTGPLALLPLHDSHQCAIVWSNVTKRAYELMHMDELEFECELNNAFGPRLGMIRYISDRRDFPLVMRHADKYVLPRIALVGDAAHTIHPLAGQGVNLGFSDVAALVDSLKLAKHKKQDVGALRALRRYERARRGENSEMIMAMRGFYELFSSTVSPVVQLRSQGFNFADRCLLLKKIFMKAALSS